MAKKRGGLPAWLTLTIALFGGFTALIVVGVVMIVAQALPFDGDILGEWAGALWALGFVALLGGASWTRPSFANIGYALRYGWWCLVVTLGLLAFDLVAFPLWGKPISGDWPSRLVAISLLCLGIGAFEELVFRGLLLQGLLAVFGRRHVGVVASVFVASVVFGLAHLDTTMSFDTPLMMGQAALKVLQTGMFGFMLSVIALRRRDLVGPSFFHGFDNWLLLVVSYAFQGEDVETTYVSTDASEGVEMVLFYLVVCALYLPFVIKSARDLARMGAPDRGAFVWEDAEAVPVLPQAPVAWGAPPAVSWQPEPYPPEPYPQQQASPWGPTPPLPGDEPRDGRPPRPSGYGL